MIINGKRIQYFQTYKIIGQNKYELCFAKEEARHKVYNIPLEYGGKLATSLGDHYYDGTRIKRRQVSFKQLPFDVKKQVIAAIDYIELNGTPMENDQHVFSN